MTARRGGLGRGLGALIPTGTDGGSGPGPADVVFRAGSAAAHEVGAVYREIPLDSVVPNPRQPRQAFAEDALAELAASIREVGLLQPVVVREVQPGRYELVVGERRWRACQSAGLPAIPAIVRTTPDDALLRDALLENLHREQLNPLEEAAAYAQLLDDFGVTHEELGQRLGRSRSAVSNTVRLLNLPAPVQRRVAAGVLSAGHARALLSLDDADQQERLAGRIVAEGLSVRSAEELVAVGAEVAPRRPRPVPQPDPGLEPIAAALSDRLETRVRITANRRRGTLVVEFAGREDLDRILAAMSPGLLSADASG